MIDELDWWVSARVLIRVCKSVDPLRKWHHLEIAKIMWLSKSLERLFPRQALFTGNVDNDASFITCRSGQLGYIETCDVDRKPEQIITLSRKATGCLGPFDHQRWRFCLVPDAT